MFLYIRVPEFGERSDKWCSLCLLCTREWQWHICCSSEFFKRLFHVSVKCSPYYIQTVLWICFFSFLVYTTSWYLQCMLPMNEIFIPNIMKINALLAFILYCKLFSYISKSTLSFRIVESTQKILKISREPSLQCSLCPF